MDLYNLSLAYSYWPLLCRVATTHGLSRGWFTYGDLSTLLDNTRFLGTLGVFRLEVLKVCHIFGRCWQDILTTHNYYEDRLFYTAVHTEFSFGQLEAG